MVPVTVDLQYIYDLSNIIYTLVAVIAAFLIIFVVGIWLSKGSPLQLMKAKLKGRAVAMVFDRLGTAHFFPINYSAGMYQEKSGFYIVDHKKMYILRGGLKLGVYYDGSIYQIDPRDTVVIQKLFKKYKVKTIKALREKLQLEKIIQLVSEDGKSYLVDDNQRIMTTTEQLPGIEEQVEVGMEQLNGTEVVRELTSRDNATPSNMQSAVLQEVNKELRKNKINIKMLIIVGVFLLMVAVAVTLVTGGAIPGIGGGGGGVPALPPITNPFASGPPIGLSPIP